MSEAYAYPATENREKLVRKILIADDEDDILKLSYAVLKKQGYQVVMVKNGLELLQKLFSGEKFDVVLTDNDMPFMKGLEALEQY